MNCYTKEVILNMSGQNQMVFCEDRQAKPNCLVSAVIAFRMFRKGVKPIWLMRWIILNQKTKINDIPVVCGFPDVFLDNLPGLPPDRETEFKIEVIPGVAPISISL